MLTPLVSIVIPAYTGERYLHDSIRSGLNQDCPNIKLLVLDDEAAGLKFRIRRRPGRLQA